MSFFASSVQTELDSLDAEWPWKENKSKRCKIKTWEKEDALDPANAKLTLNLHSDTEVCLLLREMRTFGKWWTKKGAKAKRFPPVRHPSSSPFLLNLLILAERQREEGKGQMGKDRAKQTENTEREEGGSQINRRDRRWMWMDDYKERGAAETVSWRRKGVQELYRVVFPHILVTDHDTTTLDGHSAQNHARNKKCTNKSLPLRQTRLLSWTANVECFRGKQRETQRPPLSFRAEAMRGSEQCVSPGGIMGNEPF